MFSTSPPVSIAVLVLSGVDLSHVSEVVYILVLHVGPPHGSKGVLPLTIDLNESKNIEKSLKFT